jgi:hypothetical protein
MTIFRGEHDNFWEGAVEKFLSSHRAAELAKCYEV